MTFQQRLCRKNIAKVVLSTQDPVSCEGSAAYCAGVTLNNLFTYLIKYGTVTEECVPYVAGSGMKLACPTKCTATGKTWKKYKVVSYKQSRGVDFIKNAVYTNGPIEVIFMVYQDFDRYSGGIYKNVRGATR